jgi:hypothetical protein
VYVDELRDWGWKVSRSVTPSGVEHDRVNVSLREFFK